MVIDASNPGLDSVLTSPSMDEPIYCLFLRVMMLCRGTDGQA